MVLADGFGFDHDTAMPLLRAYNERPDGDPESDHQLEHKLADALAKVEGAGGPSRDLLGPARDEEMGGDGNNLADDPAGLNVPVNNPKRLAEVTLAQRFAHPEGNTLHHWAEPGGPGGTPPTPWLSPPWRTSSPGWPRTSSSGT